MGTGKGSGKEEEMTKHNKLVTVRWKDAYLESFHDVVEVRFSSDHLWILLEDGKDRHIPLSGVRWFSLYPGSHEEFVNT